MKKIIFILFTIISLTLSAQVTTNPDTICIGSTSEMYQIDALGAGYTYTWNVAAPGTIVSGQGTNQIFVNWSTAPSGLITNAISVIATGPAPTSCVSTPVTLNVFILEIIPTITAIGPFCEGSACVNLTGTPVGGAFTGIGVVANQFCPAISGTGTFTITYTITQAGCTFTATTNVVVNPIPVLTPIEHN